MTTANRLTPCNLVWCPKTQEELQDYLNKFSGTEGALVHMISLMTWNLCARLTDPTFEEPKLIFVEADDTALTC